MSVSVRLDKETESILNKTAKILQTSKGKVIKHSLRKYCSRILEDKRNSPYELVADLLNREGSGRGDLSIRGEETSFYRNTQRYKGALVTTWPVITEAFYLLNFSRDVQDALWQFIQRGGIRIEQLDESVYFRIGELMKKYHDLPMDLADATLVVLGEEKKLSTVLTLDHKDFCIYRPTHKRRFTLIPPRG